MAKINIIEAMKQLRDDLKLWVANNLREKVDKDGDKVLSTNDFSNELKSKLENLGNIIEDENGDIVVADEDGNIIFKISADGVYATAMQLGGETAATESYVVETVSSHEVSTDAHANMGWLTSEDEVADSPTPFDADTLNGHDASYFAKQDEVGTAVLYTEQTLSGEEQAQARNNIGAASEEGLAVERARINNIIALDAHTALTNHLNIFVFEEE
jgi:hypothetical protein